ncbi:protein of unknown function [Nitrospina watsonii]|uniref:Uncharacterized protein n=1 Tax=Nitrospina watsonii TaxID=1323948 RepID=A0ABN8VZ73_9BACT|nr:protein of unknown function [Nitrospina watsonii]
MQARLQRHPGHRVAVLRAGTRGRSGSQCQACQQGAKDQGVGTELHESTNTDDDPSRLRDEAESSNWLLNYNKKPARTSWPAGFIQLGPFEGFKPRRSSLN